MFFLVAHFTSAADDGSHEEGQVAVVELQGVEARGELELGLHHVAQGSPEAFEELPGDEPPAAGHQHTVFVHARGQEGEQGFVDPVLQQGHLGSSGHMEVWGQGPGYFCPHFF